MGYDKEETPKKIEHITAIKIKGVKVGYVEIMPKDRGARYHAVLDIKNPNPNNYSRLAQGFGVTVDLAIKDAIKTSLKDAREYIEGVERLEKMLFD